MEIKEYIQTGKAEGWLHETDNKKRVHLDGRDQDCTIYEVRIDKLHYNPQNGRVATFVSRYRMEKGELPENLEERDNLIERMIEDDNPGRLKTTRLDIKTKGQQEEAIILTNGVVIDGNRRFTCLRQLSREENEPRFLRCYIFPDTYDAKAIKGLELEIQLGRDEKVNYDAISRLVDINTWVNGGLMTSEEYGLHANIKPSEMKNLLSHIEVMNHFLEYIDAPGAYHIAQDLKLQGAIESLAGGLKKCKNEDEREEMEQIVFSNCLTGSLGDRARAVRELCDDVLESSRTDDDFTSTQLDYAERVLEKFEQLPEGTKVTTEFIRDAIFSDEELKNEQKASREAQRVKLGGRKRKGNQVSSIKDSLKSLKKVEMPLLEKLSDKQLRDSYDALCDILEGAAVLKDRIEGLMRE